MKEASVWPPINNGQHLVKGACVCVAMYLFIFNGSSCPGLVVFCYPAKLIRIKGKFPLGPSANNSAFVSIFDCSCSCSRSCSRSCSCSCSCSIGIFPAGTIQQPGLGHLEVANRSLPLFLIANGLYPGSLLLGILTCLFSPFELLLLRQEIRQSAFATKDVSSRTRDRLSGVFEAEAAVAKGQE